LLTCMELWLSTSSWDKLITFTDVVAPCPSSIATGAAMAANKGSVMVYSHVGADLRRLLPLLSRYGTASAGRMGCGGRSKLFLSPHGTARRRRCDQVAAVTQYGRITLWDSHGRRSHCRDPHTVLSRFAHNDNFITQYGRPRDLITQYGRPRDLNGHDQQHHVRLQ
jgi:xanthine/CO dehydrogenase XdhC/CoxF family maturation factor